MRLQVLKHLLGSRPRRHELENFTKMQRIIPTDSNHSCDENDNGRIILRWLNVHRFYFMADLADLLQLAYDSIAALELLPFESQHGLRGLRNRI